VSADISQRDPFRVFVEAIVRGDDVAAIKMLVGSPPLALARAGRGATRQAPEHNFFEQIRHYMYEGDTALHMAAAASRPHIVGELLARGADIRARNRRGAEPLHYAADGGPGSAAWDQSAQALIIAELILTGANPNAVDRSGVAPLHRAIRNRSAAAVKALIDGGADPRAANRNGSTPMLLATQNTGKSGSGSIAAKAQQIEILRLLEEYGAT